VRELQAVRAADDFEKTTLAQILFYAANVAGHIEYRLGAFGASEQSERIALTARTSVANDSIPDQRDLGEISTWLAMAVARQGHTSEAAAIIRPVVERQRALARRDKGNVWLPLELASALYAQSLADPAHRAALLQEAQAQLRQLPPSLQWLHDTRMWRAWIISRNSP
jgi:hypothetical protein